MTAKNSFPPSLSCRAEFGTGFLPPETGVPKGPEVDISAQRAEIGDHHTRKMAAKTAFVLAGLKYLGFGRLGGGRTRARTCDPLVKSHASRFDILSDLRQLSQPVAAAEHLNVL
jgi:hypothetical protein